MIIALCCSVDMFVSDFGSNAYVLAIRNNLSLFFNPLLNFNLYFMVCIFMCNNYHAQKKTYTCSILLLLIKPDLVYEVSEFLMCVKPILLPNKMKWNHLIIQSSRSHLIYDQVQHISSKTVYFKETGKQWTHILTTFALNTFMIQKSWIAITSIS